MTIAGMVALLSAAVAFAPASPLMATTLSYAGGSLVSPSSVLVSSYLG